MSEDYDSILKRMRLFGLLKDADAIEALVKERDDARAGYARMQELDAALEAAQKHWDETRATYAELLSALECRDAGELAVRALERDAAIARVAKLEALLREARKAVDESIGVINNEGWGVSDFQELLERIDAALGKETGE